MAYCPPTNPTLPTVEKAVGAVLNYGFDLSPPAPNPNDPWSPPPGTTQPLPWLAPGEGVISLQVTSDGGVPTGNPDVTILGTQISANSSGVSASLITGWIGGGSAGVVYTITFTWTTNSTPIARTDSRSMVLDVVSVR